MGEDQEILKRVCKFCNKSFNSGRSLGGHMRSHMINSTDGNTTRKMLPNLDMGTEAAGDQSANYVLRENPKKTSKFAESSEEDTLLQNQKNKVCKECGKSFQSWKALFGHMKCHSERISSMNNSVEQDSWNSANANNHKELVMDSQSDTEAAAPNKKKRSTRRLKRYMANTASSSLTVAYNASPCISEIEHDQLQEEVAMSLILLSKDVGNWVGQNHVIECSDNNYQPHQNEKDGELVKLKMVKNGKTEQGESSKSNGQKRDKSQVPTDDEKKKKIKVDNENRVVEELVKGCDLTEDFNSKKIKFECSTCNKSFHSYQALGGHRASHKNIKGENSNIENKGVDHIKIIKNGSNESAINEKIETNSRSKKLKNHECPICFKIFSSGQALGGHKRSHLIAEAKRNNNQAVEIVQKPIPEIRNFLDLNLPAPVEEENVLDSSSENIGFQQWWMENSHKHEQLLGLISN
ncbi:PREDICTED: zinc finger protein ZAT9-like [Nicotiana attenuata]|uniref:Zinc finger protein zat1 n=1 Tax=Nicotiana attenuata TaxID=49451 RepID=A0A1J6K5B8_NICAT|nr:PREDICTED: zinc finger protein ZAT9-like [Nicotiana attenuata]OIT20264.1 zinc finger protein zat1 [Nicotiana attenuata]